MSFSKLNAVHLSWSSSQSCSKALRSSRSTTRCAKKQRCSGPRTASARDCNEQPCSGLWGRERLQSSPRGIILMPRVSTAMNKTIRWHNLFLWRDPKMQIKATLVVLLLALLTASLMTPPTYAAGAPPEVENLVRGFPTLDELETHLGVETAGEGADNPPPKVHANSEGMEGSIYPVSARWFTAPQPPVPSAPRLPPQMPNRAKNLWLHCWPIWMPRKRRRGT